MTDPLLVHELEDEELRDQFNNLLEAMVDIVTVDPNREEGAYEVLNQRIQQEVIDKPILARIVSENNQSLLSSACSNLNLDTSHDVIKCLIQAYPSALLGPITTNEWYTHPPIFIMARHPEHCVLLPWIVTNYTWILHNERCTRVVFDLLDMYAQRHQTSCTSTTIKTFFEAYPRALEQEHGSMNILHIILREASMECEVDLFKWIADRCPSGILLQTDSLGNTPLHHACHSLSKHKGRDSCEICKYLIVNCPASVRVFDDDSGILPIHIICFGCQYRIAREIVVCLLREYPESIDMRASRRFRYLTPSSIPFIQRIKPHLDEEKELKDNIESLVDSTSSLTKAVTCTTDTLVRSASTVFDSWSTSFVNTTEHKISSISMILQEMCNEGHDYENRERQIQQGIMDMISSLRE